MISIKKPTLVLNSSICQHNIHTMAAKAAAGKVFFRPHFKTHQSAAVGEWFRAEGVTAITVSSVSMARYFAMNGWNDITIAFPVNHPEIDEINRLATSVQLNLLIESVETAEFLVNNLTAACGFFIKIDCGYHRTGIEVSNTSLIEAVLRNAAPPLLCFKGFLTHSGNAYHVKSRDELQQIQQFTTQNLLRLKKHFYPRFPDLILSVGDTPTCSQLPLAEGIDEIRPGNFVFYDVMQFALGSCRLDDIAVALVCPVVAIHHNRQEAVIYGGAIHLSKEITYLYPDTQPIYGLVVAWDGETWQTSRLLGKVRALSQEHGVIALTQEGCNLKPGEFVAILPVHSCLSANLMPYYLTEKGDVLETMQPY